VSWPPTVGQTLPYAGSAFGIEEKLGAYCLNLAHEIGGPKARGFERILGIRIEDVEYLAKALRVGVLDAPITDVRDNRPFGLLCEVRVPVPGLREHQNRIVGITTVWELRRAGESPRLVTAYIDRVP